MTNSIFFLLKANGILLITLVFPLSLSHSCHRTRFATTCRSTSVSRRSPDRKTSRGRGASGRSIRSTLTCSSTASSNAGGCLLTTTTAAAAAAAVALTDRASCFRVITAPKMASPTKRWAANGSTCPPRTTLRPWGRLSLLFWRRRPTKQTSCGGTSTWRPCSTTSSAGTVAPSRTWTSTQRWAPSAARWRSPCRAGSTRWGWGGGAVAAAEGTSWVRASTWTTTSRTVTWTWAPPPWTAWSAWETCSTCRSSTRSRISCCRATTTCSSSTSPPRCSQSSPRRRCCSPGRRSRRRCTRSPWLWIRTSACARASSQRCSRGSEWRPICDLWPHNSLTLNYWPEHLWLLVQPYSGPQRALNYTSSFTPISLQSSAFVGYFTSHLLVCFV